MSKIFLQTSLSTETNNSIKINIIIKIWKYVALAVFWRSIQEAKFM